MRMENKNKYLVRIVYKSGYTHDFWVYEFEVSGGSFRWTTVGGDNTPILIGADDITAVWQLESAVAEEN